MTDSSLERFRELLAKDPTNREGLEGLRRLAENGGNREELVGVLAALEENLEQTQQWAGLAFVLECHQQALEETKPRSDILVRLGDLYHHHLDNKFLAIDSYTKALELDFEKTYLLDRLGEIYSEKKEDFYDVIAHHEKAAASSEAVELRYQHWHEVAEIYHRVLARPEKALPYYDRIFSQKEGPAEPALLESAFDALAQILVERGAWRELTQVYEQRILQLSEQGQQISSIVSILYRLATIQKDKLNQPLRAMQSYERILLFAPNNVQVRSLMEQLRGQVSTWTRVLEELDERLQEQPPGEEILGLHREKARVLAEYLRDLPAAARLHETILELQPDAPASLSWLENYYSRQGDLGGFLKVLEKAVQFSPTPKQRLDRLRDIARVYEDQLKVPQLALKAWQRVRLEAPQDPEALESLEHLGFEQKEWAMLPAILEAQLETSPDSPARVAIFTKLARVTHRHLKDLARAQHLYREILTLDATHLESLQALEELYQTERNWEGLRFVYGTLIDVAQEKSRQIDSLKKFAGLLTSRFQETERAATLLRRARTLSPFDPEIMLALERIYTDQEDWPVLAQLYEDEAQRARSAEAVSAWLRKGAEIYERQIQDFPKAVELYQTALKSDPQNKRLLRSLENLYERTKNWHSLVDLCQIELGLYASLDPETLPLLLRMAETLEHRLARYPEALAVYEKVLSVDEKHGAALRAAERLYLRLELWERLLEIYLRQLASIGAAADESQREALLHLYRRISGLYLEKLGRPVEAMQIFERILQLAPQDLNALQTLKSLYYERNRWAELVNTLERELEQTRDPARRSRLLREIATVLSERLRDERLALPYWEQAQAIDPQNPELFDKLSAYYERTQDFPKLSGLHRQALTWLTESSDRISAFEKLARLALRAENPAEAQESFEAILTLDPSHGEALRELEGLHTRSKQWTALTELYARLIPTQATPAGRADLHRRMARIEVEHLDNPGKAIEHLRKALDLHPKNTEALEAMRLLLRQTRNWGDFLHYTQILLQETLNRDERVILLVDLGQTWREHFHHNGQALASWSEALRLKPANAPLLRQVFQILLEETRWEEAVSVGTRLLHQLHDTAEQIEVRLQMARLLRDQIQDMERSRTLFQEALALDPRNLELIRELRALCVSRQEWSEVISLLYQEVELTEAVQERVALIREIAQIWREQFRSDGNTLNALLQVIAIQPFHRQTLEEVAALKPERSVWEQIEEALQKPTAPESTPAEKISCLLVLAHGWAENYHHADAAIRCLKLGREVERDHPEVITYLADLYWAFDRHGDFLQIMPTELELAGREKKILRYRQCAQIALQSLQDSREAASYLQSALALDPGNRELLSEIEPLLLSLKDWTRLVALYQETLARESDPERQSLDALRLAELYRDGLQDLSQAEVMFRQSLDANARNLQALEGLAALLKGQARWADALEVLERQRQALGPSPQAARVNLDMAEIHLRHLPDPTALEGASRRVLDIDSRNLRALGYLENLYREHKSYDQLLQILQRQATLHLPEEREITLYLEMARIWEEEFHDLTQAGHAYRRVLDLHPPAGAIWERLLRFFRDNNRIQDLGTTLEQQIQTGNLEAPVKALRHLELGLLCLEKLEEDKKGLMHLDLAATTDPNSLEILSRIVPVYRQLNRYEELVSALDRKTTVAPDTQELLELAGVWQNHFGVRANAEEAYRRVLKLERDNETALNALTEIYQEGERHEAYAQVLSERLLFTKDPAEKLPLHVELARVLGLQLGDQEQAGHHYQEVLRIDPEHKPASLALLAVYRQTGHWQAYVELQEKILSMATEAAVRLENLLDQAAVFTERIKAPEEEAARLERAMELAPGEKKIQILERLRTLYRDLGRPQDVLRICRKLAGDVPSVAERAELLLECAEIQEKSLKASRAALQTYGQILAILPTHRRSLEARIRLFDRKQERKNIMEDYKQLIELEPHPEKKAAFCLQMADLYLENSKQRIAYLEEALTLYPGQEQALSALGAYYLHQENWLKASEVFLKERTHGTTAGQKLRANLSLASLYFYRLDKKDAAREALLEAHRTDSQDRRANAGLANLSLQNQNWLAAEPHLKLLSLGFNAASEAAPERTAPAKPDLLHQEIFRIEPDEVFYHLGRVAQEQGRTDEALMRFQQALEANPAHAQALQTLADLFFHNRQWKNAAAHYERLLADLTLSTDRDRLRAQTAHYRLGLAYLEMGRAVLAPTHAHGAPDAQRQLAREHFRRTLALEPRHFEALRALADLSQEDAEWPEALTYWERLGEATREQETRLLAYLQRAKILAGSLGNLDSAIALYQSILSAEPAHEAALEGLAEIYQKRGDWPEALETYSRLVEATSRPEARSRVLLAQAFIQSRQIGDHEKALGLLEEVLQTRPQDREALDEIGRIHREREHWDQLVQHLRYTLEVFKNQEPEIRFRSQFEIADLLMEKLHRPEEAEKIYEDLLRDVPQNQIAKLALARLHTRRESTRTQAIREYRDLLTEDPGALDLYREFLELEKTLYHQESAKILGGILEFLEKPGTFTARAIPPSNPIFAAAEPTWLHPEEQQPASRLLLRLRDELSKIYPLQTSASRPAISPLLENQLRSQAKTFGFERLDLLAEPALLGNRLFCPYPPAALMTHPDAEATVPAAMLPFLVVRCLFYLKRGLFPLLTSTDSSGAKRFLIALLRQFDSHFDEITPTDPEMERLQKALKKALSRSLRKELQEDADQLMRLWPRFDWKQFGQAVRHSSNRAALLATRDIKLALTTLARFADPFPSETIESRNLETVTIEERAEWLRQNHEARELVRFSLSETYLTIIRGF